MIESLRATGENSPIYVLALDEVTIEILQIIDIPNLMVVDVNDLEMKFPQVISVKNTRSRMEYIFTLTPWLCRYVMDLSESESWITYLDADLYFFSSCETIYEALAGGSIGIIPHRFKPFQKWRSKYGTYNVGWVSFKANISGRACLEWWAESCLAWCYDKPEDGRFADQGYLDGFRDRSSDVVIIDKTSVNLAPWNLISSRLEVEDGRLKYDRELVQCFHFHGLSISGRRYRFKHLPYATRSTRVVRDQLYRPYCEALEKNAKSLKVYAPELGRSISTVRFIQFGRKKILTLMGDFRKDFIDL